MVREILQFKGKLKEEIRDRQGNCCAICGRRTKLEIHHCVPFNALRRIGIKGTNAPETAVGLCGTRSIDCHERADKKAIHDRLFWNGEMFVPIEQMPQETYIIRKFNAKMPRRRKHRY